jgi:archaellum component FlaC
LLQGYIDKLEEAMDNVHHVLKELVHEYTIQGRTKEMLDTMSKIELIEKEYVKVMQDYHNLQEEIKSVSGHENSHVDDSKNKLTLIYQSK